jgi:hypothetical protein
MTRVTVRNCESKEGNGAFAYFKEAGVFLSHLNVQGCYSLGAAALYAERPK